MKKYIVDFLVFLFDKIQERSQEKKYNRFKEKYQIHHTFRFNGNNILFYCDGYIQCGINSYIGEYSTIQAYKGCKVCIGKNCRLSHNVRIYTQTNFSDWDFSIHPIPEKIGDVIIEDDVWIGANVFINPGVKIGNNAIIGANSVVTNDVPPFTI